MNATNWLSTKLNLLRNSAPASVPPEEAANLKAISSLVTYGWGMLPALVRIGRTEWRTALWPKDGSYIVPIKDAVRGAEGLGVDDVVLVVLKLEL